MSGRLGQRGVSLFLMLCVQQAAISHEEGNIPAVAWWQHGGMTWTSFVCVFIVLALALLLGCWYCGGSKSVAGTRRSNLRAEGERRDRAVCICMYMGET